MNLYFDKCSSTPPTGWCLGGPHLEKCCPEEPTHLPVPSPLPRCQFPQRCLQCRFLLQTLLLCSEGQWRHALEGQPSRVLCQGPFSVTKWKDFQQCPAGQPPHGRHAVLLLLRVVHGWAGRSAVLWDLCFGKTLSRTSRTLAASHPARLRGCFAGVDRSFPTSPSSLNCCVF